MDIKVRNQLLIAHFYCQNFYILLKIAQKSLGSMWIVLVIIVEYYNITSWEKGFPLYFTTLENAQFQSFVSKYQQSFALGIYGDKTEDTLEEFRQALKDAGVDAFIEEFVNQYQAYKDANGI